MAQDTDWTPVSHDTCGQVAGPFYHGTRADLAVGELLSAGFRSNYRDSVVMNHIYFTTIARALGWLRRWPAVRAAARVCGGADRAV